MEIPDEALEIVSEAIGDAFPRDQIERIVMAATGRDLYKAFATPDDPLYRAVSRTLESLMVEGTERWLLIQVLVSAATNERLRRLITRLLPETLAALPKVDDLVDHALQNLSLVKTMALQPEYLSDLQQSSQKISEMLRQIHTLAAYKNLHECLHALSLALAFRSAVVEDAELTKKIRETCAKARTAAPSLGVKAKVEFHWIANLEQCADELDKAVGTQNSALEESGFGQARLLVRIQLSRLNAQIFDAAHKLSLTELILVVPREITGAPTFTELAHAIRELKVTIMARALVHKIWQDAENELSLIEALVNMPAKSALSLIQQHWLLLRSHVLWLAPLDRDPQLKLQAEDYSKRIDTEIFKETLSDAMKTAFAEFYRLLMRRFFKVNADLKEDCKSLEKFETPLNLMLKEISNARSFQPPSAPGSSG